MLKLKYLEMNANGGTNYEAIYNVIEYNLKPLLIPMEEETVKSFFGELNFKYTYQDLFNKDIVYLPKALPHFAWELLVENHFDVFKLINNGLAVNKLEFDIVK